MIALLLRCYPARWRARYGEEFAALLEERALGPFDVADVLLGAFDAQLHLRGLGAAAVQQGGFIMSLRIGGIAAVISGALWLIVLAGNVINGGGEGGAAIIGLVAVGATITTLVALVGLSAFQARRYPLLTWAAFAIPALGGLVGLIGFVGMAVIGDSDGDIAGIPVWGIMSLGLITLLLGSALFALATWRTRVFSRPFAALLALGSLTTVPTLSGTGLAGSEALTAAVLIVCIVAFPAGWAGLGLSALRDPQPVPASETSV